MWPNRRLCDLLQIEHPIILAPMAGPGTPELAAAVSNAGGLGSFGCGETSPEKLCDVAKQLRAGTSRPFNLNFFIYPAPRPDEAVFSRTFDRLRPYYDELGIAVPPAVIPSERQGFDSAKLAVVLEIRPPVVSFHFGVPDAAAIAALKQAGIVLLSSATTVAEARTLAASGIDAVIAQGWEAGGHQGSHVPTEPGDGIGSMALVPQIADAIDLPVIAAGGIADGRGIVAAFALGASGVQIGTGFLSCTEAGTDAAWRAAIKSANGSDTIVTKAFSGRSARVRRTRYALDMEKNPDGLPDFPSMYALSAPLFEHAEATGSEDFAFQLHGQAAALSRELPAGTLFRTLVTEAQEVFAALSG